jgi:hypothetical protein
MVLRRFKRLFFISGSLVLVMGNNGMWGKISGKWKV